MAVETKKRLADTLIELLSRRSLDKITVKELVEACHVNRQTFYYNFKDIYDLVAWIFAEKTAHITPESRTAENWKDDFREIVSSMRENKSLILNAYHSLSRTHLEKYLMNWLRPIMGQLVDEAAAEAILASADRDFIVNIYSLGFVGLAMEWVDNDMKEIFPTQLDQFIKLIDGSMEDTIHKFAQP